MSPAVRTWLIVALTLGYLGTAHVALIHHSTALAATATAMLALLFLASIQGRHRAILRMTVAAIGTAVVILVARGAPPLPLLASTDPDPGQHRVHVRPHPAPWQHAAGGARGARLPRARDARARNPPLRTPRHLGLDAAAGRRGDDQCRYWS